MLVIQYVLYGLSTGGLYALLAFGLVVAHRASGFLNFAHPYVGMVATLAYVLLVPALGVLPAALVGMAVGAGLAAGVYAGVFAPLAHGPLGPKVVVSLATGLALQVVGGIAFIGWGDDLLGGASKGSVLPQAPVPGLGDRLTLTWQQAGVPVVAVVALVGLVLLFQRTDFGLALRACAQNPMSALLAGLPRRAVELGAWALTGVLAALAGIASLSSQSFLVPTYLFEECIRGFAAALAAGFTSFRRAAVAAFAIGIAENLLAGAGGSWADLRGAVTFALVTVVAVLALRGRLPLPQERPT